jgi:hypothetical protein
MLARVLFLSTRHHKQSFAITLSLQPSAKEHINVDDI